MRKIIRYGAVRGPQSGSGGRSVREGLRHAKPVMRLDALVTIWFFNIYLAIHYIRLALAQEYNSSPLDETTCLILLPFAILYLSDRRSWLPALSMFGFGAVLLLGVIVFPNRGVPQPISAIVTIALDSKIAIMTFAFAWIFKRTGSAMQVFESLSKLIIVLCLINIPFILHDLSTGVNIWGKTLESKGALVMPQGLVLNHPEVAWLNSFGAFVAATRYRLRKRTLDLILCALFATFVLLAVSVKEMVGCFAGLLIIFSAPRSGYGSFGVHLAVLVGVAALVLTNTKLGSAVLGHVGMFYGSDAIELGAGRHAE